MNKRCGGIILGVLAALAFSPNLWGQSAGTWGVGVGVGQPTGVTGKYWLDDTRAVDVGVGFGRRDPVLYADFLCHAWNILPQPERGKLGLYAGAGPRLGVENDSRFGIRAIVGADYWIKDHPVELFVEAGPVLQLTPESDIHADATLGMRFYFAGGY